LEKIKQELKKAIKIELTQMTSQHSFPIKAYIQVLGACVSTNKNYVEIVVNLSRKEHVVVVMPTMGLYVQDDHSTRFMALRKVHEGVPTIHNGRALCR